METIQEYFDEAVKRMVKQKRRCISSINIGRCAYTDVTSKQHCAVGWILALYAEERQRAMPLIKDYIGVSQVLVDHPEIFPPCFKNKTTLLSIFQGFHDNPSTTDRKQSLDYLSHHNVDTSGKHWEKWAEMGK
jgi:hypothetical protein